MKVKHEISGTVFLESQISESFADTMPDARLKYIGKQHQYEMNLADHGKSITNCELRFLLRKWTDSQV